MLNLSLIEILIIVPTILIAFTVHELCHAVTALALGDDTARNDGRITLNPFKHIDPFGFIMIVVFGFGWAKPVRFSAEKLKHPIRDEILIAFAGPVSNLVLAFIATVGLRLIGGTISRLAPQTYNLFLNIFLTFIVTNIGLAVFNALPLPPLDGSHLYMAWLVRRKGRLAQAVVRYGFLVLIGIIVIERVADVDILPLGRAIDTILELMLRVVGW